MRVRTRWYLFLLGIILSFSSVAVTQELSPREYAIGEVTVTDIWVDSVAGNDSHSGVSREEAVRTLSHAWEMIPQGSTLVGHGYRIQLVAGTHTSVPNYMESRHGTAQFPIIIQSADGPGAATVSDDFNVFDARYLYLIDFNLIPAGGGDAFHCEQCDHLLMRGMEVSGGNRQAHETIKINQSQYVYIEDSDIYGSYENAIDFVAVQYGHIVDNRIHDADDWCAYVKGGSAYIRVESNIIYNCGTGGFTAGQGSGLEFLTSPWLHYEAYDIKFINNIVHDTEGAGFGVNGGYNILAAFNTFFRVGSRSHTIEVVYGLRSCDGDSAACSARFTAGAWGRPSPGEEVPIGNRNVFLLNNIVYNPTGYQSQYSHFSIQGPRTTPAGTQPAGVVVTDSNLVIAGNIIWNGTTEMSLGIEGGAEGCAPTNPSCNETQLRSENEINTVDPQFVNASAFNFEPLPGGTIEGSSGVSVVSFPGGDRELIPLAPEGVLANDVNRDFAGNIRVGLSVPGAINAVNVMREAADLYFPWNGFLGMTNILEISNNASSARTVRIVVYDSDGIPRGVQSVPVGGSSQLDLIVNDLAGFTPDAIGLLTLDAEGDGVTARLAVYRVGVGGEYDFAYMMEELEQLRSSATVPFNTNHPARNAFGLQAITANWLSIINLDTDQSRGFVVERYAADGALTSSTRYEVAPFARVDIEGGHAAGLPAAVGLLRITPDSGIAPYQAFLSRYGSAEPGSSRSYDFALPIAAVTESAPAQVVVPVSNGGGAQNWVELINTADEVRSITLSVFGSNGASLLNSITVQLAAREQLHVDVSQYLGAGESGSLILLPSGAGITALSMNYYFREDGSIAAMYGLRGGADISGSGHGSYNLFLGMSSWLRLINTQADDSQFTVRVFGYDSEIASERVQVPAHGALDLPLHDAGRFNTQINTYGRISISGDSFAAHTLRVRAAGDSFDFIVPVAVR